MIELEGDGREWGKGFKYRKTGHNLNGQTIEGMAIMLDPNAGKVSIGMTIVGGGTHAFIMDMDQFEATMLGTEASLKLKEYYDRNGAEKARDILDGK